jgi:hypothetical protein
MGKKKGERYADEPHDEYRPAHHDTDHERNVEGRHAVVLVAVTAKGEVVCQVVDQTDTRAVPQR